MFRISLLRSYEREEKNSSYKHVVPNGTDNQNPKLETRNSKPHR
jgi:hypothetical protein